MEIAANAARKSEVASICTGVLGQTPRSIQPILGDGIVNAVFAVETQRAQLVFRIQFDSLSDGEFRKEEWCMDRARAAGVPGAEVISVGTYGPHAYAIHTKLPGVVGTRYEGDIDRVWHEIGRFAQLFHQVEALGFGEHLGGPVGESPDTTLAGWVDWWQEFTFGSGLLADRGLLTARSLDRARTRVSKIRRWPGEPRLCHGNLSLSNVLVDGDDVYIIDWGTAAGHLAPLFDLAELHAWSSDTQPPGLKAFLAGYGLSASEHEAMVESLEVLQLWRALSSAKWLLETGRARPGALEYLAEKARWLLER